MTNHTDKIKTAFERNKKALALRPSIGQGTAVTRVRVREALTCDVEEGPWKLTVDLGEKHGGANTAPNPGVYGRAALGSCLAMCYIRWAAYLGIPITHLEIDIEADYDARAEYGDDEVDPSYAEIRYIVSVESKAPEEEVLRLLDTADAYTPFLAVFRQPQDVRRVVHILEPA